MKTTFKTQLHGVGNNTGIVVPPENIAQLGTAKTPPVNVTVNGFSYKSTVAVRHGTFMVSFPKANRDATGLAAGDDIEVVLELDSGVREVIIPEALQKALEQSNVLPVFSDLAYSKRKEFVRQVNEAKAEETRQRRIEKIIQTLTQNNS